MSLGSFTTKDGKFSPPEQKNYKPSEQMTKLLPFSLPLEEKIEKVACSEKRIPLPWSYLFAADLIPVLIQQWNLDNCTDKWREWIAVGFVAGVGRRDCLITFFQCSFFLYCSSDSAVLPSPL